MFCRRLSPTKVIRLERFPIESRKWLSPLLPHKKAATVITTTAAQRDLLMKKLLLSAV